MIARPDLPATREQLRTHYHNIAQFIRQEKRRIEGLPASGYRTSKIAACDALLLDLEAMGNWIRDLLPPEPEQAALIEISERKGY